MCHFVMHGFIFIYMQISLSVGNHPKDGYKIDLSRLVDVSKLFKKRDIEHWDRDFCTYIFEDESGKTVYIGKGRYYDVLKYSKGKWLSSRPFKHRKDLLIRCLNENWTCRIVAMGLTSIEACVFEAYLIANSGRTLTKKGAKEWDRCSLINKKREREQEKKIVEYLNIDNGNYTWLAA